MGKAQAPGVALFYRQYATPILVDHGFAASGRTYRRVADNGDTAVVNFQSSSGSHPGAYLFYVNLAVVPVPWLDWITKGAADPETFRPTSEYGLFKARIRPAGRWDETWMIDSPEAAHERGRELTAVLPARLDELVGLLDRDEFLRRVRHGPKLETAQSPRVMQIVLLVDRGLTDELEKLLHQMANGPGDAAPRFVEWARKRATSGPRG